MVLAWQTFDELVAEADHVLLTTHVRPDGDAIGSELAMADLLIQKGKEVAIFNPSPTPTRYRFLDSEPTRIGFLDKSGLGRPPFEPNLLVVLDTGTWSQLAGLADYVRQRTCPKVVIDHHQSQDDLGALQLVDATVAACGMLVYEAFRHLNANLTPAAATSLMVAIGMDTGWMHHGNTTSDVFQVLAALAAAGANANSVYRELFECNSVERMRLFGIMLERISLSLEGRIASSQITFQDIRSVGAHPMDTEDFVASLMSIRGVEAAVLFIEQEGQATKVSFRSRNGLDCSRLAEQFKGGGHRAAAGATVPWPIHEASKQILTALELAMSRG